MVPELYTSKCITLSWMMARKVFAGVRRFVKLIVERFQVRGSSPRSSKMATHRDVELDGSVHDCEFGRLVFSNQRVAGERL